MHLKNIAVEYLRGKPFVNGYDVSISHSGDYACAVAVPNYRGNSIPSIGNMKGGRSNSISISALIVAFVALIITIVH